LQILIYCDNQLEVVAKAIYPLNFCSGSSMCPAAHLQNVTLFAE